MGVSCYVFASVCGVAMETEDRIVEMRRTLMEELPDDNYFILKYVIHFLTEVVMIVIFSLLSRKFL